MYLRSRHCARLLSFSSGRTSSGAGPSGAGCPLVPGRKGGRPALRITKQCLRRHIIDLVPADVDPLFLKRHMYMDKEVCQCLPLFPVQSRTGVPPIPAAVCAGRLLFLLFFFFSFPGFFLRIFTGRYPCRRLYIFRQIRKTGRSRYVFRLSRKAGRSRYIFRLNGKAGRSRYIF